MTKKYRKIELLAPVGNFEKLEIAIHYGADAVYLSDKNFSLRNFSDNFSNDDLFKAVNYAHKHNVKVYVASNIFARNNEIIDIRDYFKILKEIGPDAVIISDPGIIMEAQNIIPDIPIHLSTQANTTNYSTVKFWEKLGIKRINLARELSLKEIKEIVAKTNIEVEIFIHGSMCISYSGRCLLSSFMARRESNRGKCSHPCRWKYKVLEEKRPGHYYPISEDERGAYIFNSKDLCMIDHIPEIVESGIHSIKIEGRMKGINYLASSIKIYKEALSLYYNNPSEYSVKKEWLDEFENINLREYCTGFYFNNPEEVYPNYTRDRYLHENVFLGKVLENNGLNTILFEVRNKIFQGDNVEIITMEGINKKDAILNIINKNKEEVSFSQPGSIVTLIMSSNYSKNDLFRKIL